MSFGRGGVVGNQASPRKSLLGRATRTGLEPATSGSTVRGSNQLSYRAGIGGMPRWRIISVVPVTARPTIRAERFC